MWETPTNLAKCYTYRLYVLLQLKNKNQKKYFVLNMHGTVTYLSLGTNT
jgi:hypothetical protein